MPQSTLSEIDRWRTGFPLETAWSALAEPGEKQRYHQVAGDEQQRRSQYLLMVGSLWQRLSAGELIAYGWRVTPSASDLPVPIPTAMFDTPPMKADLDTGRFRFHSWCFDNVKIAAPEGNSIENSGDPIKAEKPSGLAQAKRGRPSFDALLCPATQSAVATDALFLGRSAEKQNGIIREAAAKLFPGRFAKEDGPARSTVARFIKAQREEGWPALAHPENPEILK